MKIFSSILLLVMLNYCTAANFSVLWIIGNQQVYSSNIGYQPRARMAPSLTTLFMSEFMQLDGSDTPIKDDNGGKKHLIKIKKETKYMKKLDAKINLKS